MRERPFGRLGTVSALSMGGGGIGQVWGSTTRDEAVATVREAVAAGINFIDVAPSYGKGEAEEVIGAAFGGKLPAGVRLATKVALNAPWSTVRNQPVTLDLIEQSLEVSLRRMRVERVDVLFFHDQIVPEQGHEGESGTPLRLFREKLRPALERLVQLGRVGAWGISARGVLAELLQVLNDEPAPAAAQVVANALVFEPSLVDACASRGTAAVGIQPTHSGALTDAFDRPVQPEMQAMYARAEPFRALARELGEATAALAHRYALALPGVSTVTLGVKNRDELRQALDAEAAGPLPAELVRRIQNSVQEVKVR
jgi:aryl-alcohol dehydrogenase-like predicted oxidoreductase